MPTSEPDRDTLAAALSRDTLTNPIDRRQLDQPTAILADNSPAPDIRQPLSETVVAWLFALSLMAPHTAVAQVLQPPVVHWVGPEAQCDYLTIQEALDDIFDCTPFVCQPAENQLKLSRNYVHSGQIQLGNSVSIVGGQGGGCQSALFGPRAVLGNAPENESLVVIEPGEKTLQVRLTSLVLEGPGGTAPTDSGPLGGLLRLASGDATVTLENSVLRDGQALLGGGVYLAGDGNQLILESSFVQTSHAFAGGGIHCTRGGVIDFRSGRIEQNTAERSGGGLFLENGCLLRGTTAGSLLGEVNRSIQGNRLTDIQQGQGAGIFARASTIELGALYSFTEIKDNIVPAFEQTGEITPQPGQPPVPIFDHYRYDLPGVNRGGGVHLEHSNATFHNTRFVRNEAADGGAISVAGDSALVVDRTSGPCTAADIGDIQTCSLFFRNRARGGRDGPGEEADEGGDGAVLYGRGLDGVRPHIVVRRSAWSDNAAGCFEANEADFEGECDLPTTILGTNRFSSSSIYFAAAEEALIQGNLIVNNDIGDDEDTTFIGKLGAYFAIFGRALFSENTITNNLDADASFSPGERHLLTPAPGSNVDWFLLNNIIDDSEPDEAILAKSDGFYETQSSSCNVSNFASELNLQTVSADIPNVDENPLFVDPTNGDFALQTPGSPAIDRCDDANSLVVSTYDILGNPRPTNVGASSNGPGLRDAGAFEAIPLEGAATNTTDLSLDLRSDLPKTAPIGVDHQFLTYVSNTGRNAPNALTVQIDLESGGTFSKLAGQRRITNSMVINHWDCVIFGGFGQCSMLKDAIDVGETLLPIIAEVSHDSQGEKFVSAMVALDDNALVELSPSNDADTDSVTVGPGADLQLEMVAPNPAAAPAGKLLEFSIRLRNNGPEPANGVRVQLTRDDNSTQLTQFDGPDWICNELGDVVNCALTRALDTLVNEGGLPIGFGFRATAPDPGSLLPLVRSVTATASANNPSDPNPGNNSATAQFIVLEDNLFSNGFESGSIASQLVSEPAGP